MEADGQADTKTRERTEGPATAFQAMRGVSCSANRVDPDTMMCFTSFGNDCTGPPALPCSRENALVDNGAAAPKSRLSPLEMRSPIATGGLLPASETSMATKTTFDHPTLWFCLTEETNLRTSTPYALYYNSSFWLNQLAAPSCRRVIEKKSGQNRMFDSGSSGSPPRLPIFGNEHALLCEKVMFWSGWWRSAVFFLAGRRSAEYHFPGRSTNNSIDFFSAAADLKRSYRRG